MKGINDGWYQPQRGPCKHSNDNGVDSDGNSIMDRHQRFNKKEDFNQKKIRAMYGIRSSLILDRNSKKSQIYNEDNKINANQANENSDRD